MVAPRRARLRPLAKVNLGLRVLHRRPDGFHELRTVFHTISLGDELDLTFTPSSGREVVVHCDVDIADNLVVRAARLVLEATGAQGVVECRLQKRIPMGGGLGGGSTDAAAVLLALPVLAGQRLPLAELITLGQQLGSDVPFFLLGGAAVAVGRGTELYPLADVPPHWAVLLDPGVHISTAAAYQALNRELTSTIPQPIINSFQASVWPSAEILPAGLFVNDFEAAIFATYPQLKMLRDRFVEAGAARALMSGSGAGLFGLFPTRSEAARGATHFRDVRHFVVRLVPRRIFRSRWWRALAEHLASPRVWPPTSRYAS